MGDDIRAPVLWRRPNAKTYAYNQQVGGDYYKPMIEYVNAKDRQGVFFERPTERIHLPDPAESYMKRHDVSDDGISGVYNMDKFLVKAYSQQTREVNGGTAKTRMRMLNTVTARTHLPHTMLDNQQTHYDSVRLLKGSAPGRKQVNYYASEIGVLKNNKLFSERCQYNHLMDVLDGRFGLSQNHSGMGGITADQKFYDPEKVKDYTGSIRFKDPQRTVPVLA
eukprot:TRINITY_DN17825_c0_g1_i1.p1 TRINITY_DN17825_c0_g1~~TRINITY_DN17825_c0_g1_i1.p1  ORF type:complete len:238 (+),score=51.04 TRINITY_DN17825_c0_g1_i1:49-714(+)